MRRLIAFLVFAFALAGHQAQARMLGPDQYFEGHEQSVTVAASSVVRITHSRGGTLYIQPHGGGIHMEWNATANTSSWFIPEDSMVDWDPLGVEYGEYITVMNPGASTVTVNCGVYD